MAWPYRIHLIAERVNCQYCMYPSNQGSQAPRAYVSSVTEALAMLSTVDSHSQIGHQLCFILGQEKERKGLVSGFKESQGGSLSNNQYYI
jgi:hypothetical protein